MRANVDTIESSPTSSDAVLLRDVGDAALVGRAEDRDHLLVRELDAAQPWSVNKDSYFTPVRAAPGPSLARARVRSAGRKRAPGRRARPAPLRRRRDRRDGERLPDSDERPGSGPRFDDAVVAGHNQRLIDDVAQRLRAVATPHDDDTRPA
jgi:hypothetical protein